MTSESMGTSSDSPFSDSPSGDYTSALQQSSTLTRFRLAPNPGPMSLDGTNSYVISAGDSGHVAVVDPGPEDEGHLAELAAARGGGRRAYYAPAR
ncbi:hypothetical protein StoSoilB13_12130 [Arthrobacter sp. StoSoilB13]|nr:hypothetical protein StoSoilB13_12130 [Arthrobacter sp. StoSoilB13]